MSAPTSSGLGIAAATVSPKLSYEIGQYFKSNDSEGSATHILAHTVLGAAVAAAGGNDALLAGVTAGGAEASAPLLSKYLYGKEAKDLTADEKGTVSAITGLVASGVGGSTGDVASSVQSGQVAQNAVENNGFSIIDENYGQVVKENTKEKFSCPTGYVCPIPEKTLGEKTLLVINDLTIRQLAAAMGAEYDPITKEHFTPKEIQEAKVAMLGLGFSKTLSGPIKLTDEAFENIGKKYGKDIATKIENNFYRDGETSVNWTSAKKASNNINLAGHWEKHKDEFPTLMSQNDYYRFAQNFVTNPPKDTLEKVRKNGDSVLYQPSTNTFAVKTKDGLPRTVFRPDPKDHGYKNNLEYFNAQ